MARKIRCSGLLGAMVMVAVALLLESGAAQGPPGPRTIVTPGFYNSLLAAVPARCSGKGLYTYGAFIGAAESFAGFGTTGTADTRKREMAAFLANIMHETGSAYIYFLAVSASIHIV